MQLLPRSLARMTWRCKQGPEGTEHLPEPTKPNQDGRFRNCQAPGTYHGESTHVGGDAVLLVAGAVPPAAVRLQERRVEPGTCAVSMAWPEANTAHDTACRAVLSTSCVASNQLSRQRGTMHAPLALTLLQPVPRLTSPAFPRAVFAPLCSRSHPAR